MVYQVIEKVKIIRVSLKAAQSCQKSYEDDRHRDLEIEVRDRVFLNVSPMNKVVRFCRKGKLIPRFISPYILYGELAMLLMSLSFHLS